jgi:hypothetical protein
MNPYAIAYAVGYYYARSRGYIPTGHDLPEADQALVENQGFIDGFAAGQRDFQDVDVAHQAMNAERKGITLGEGVSLTETV